MAQELYELPQGWEWKHVDEIAVDISSGFACSKKHVDANGHVHLRTHNVSTEGKLNFDLMIRIKDDKVDQKKSSISAGDILFNNTNSQELVGKTCLIEKDYAYGFSNHITRIRLDQSVLAAFFVFRFNQLQLKGHFSNICKRWIGQAGINNTLLKEQEIPVPPLAEQERIVAKLDALFSRIDQAIAQLQHTQAQIKALFASALDAVFENNRTWPKKTVKEVFLVINGRAYKQPELLSAGKYKVIRIQNLKGGENYYYSDLELKEDKYCENGDLLFSWSGTPGTSFGAFIWGGEKGIFHYHIWNMKPIVELNLQFGYWLLRHLTNEAISNSRGVAGMLHITKGMMENFKINLPPLAEQSKIVAQLDAISERTQALTAATSAQIEQLKGLKASLLDAAFRGQLPSDH